MGFEELRAFLAVAEHGSFLAAAVGLGVSRTTLRRQVEALEAQAGVPLLRRTKLGIELTDAGRRLVAGGRDLERGFTALLTAVSEAGRAPRGTVRLLLQVGLPPPAMLASYAIFHATAPEMQLRVRFSEAPLTVDPSEVDVLVWFGTNDPGNPWVTHTVVTIPVRLFASASYLEAHGTPQNVAQLQQHDVLAWLPPGETRPRIMTVEGEVPVEPVLTTVNVHMLHECAHAGMGIAWAPDGGLPVAPGEEPLIPVLKDLVCDTTELRLAIPRALADVPKFRLFVDALAALRQIIPEVEHRASPKGSKSAHPPRAERSRRSRI